MYVQNVVILMLENRSFDEYFGMFPGANGFYNNPQSTFDNLWIPGGGWIGPAVSPYRLSTFSSQQGQTPACNHGWAPQHAFFANGAMNGWALQNPNANSPVGPGPGGGNPVGCMGYYAPNDIPYHWWLAQNFALCDNYYCSFMGVTEPNRLYMISGKIPNNADFVNNPNNFNNTPPWYGEGGTGDPSPGVNWLSYADMLNTAGKSWKVYDLTGSAPPNDAPGAYNAILNPLVFFPTWSKIQTSANYVTDFNTFLNDAGTLGGLATVSWIIPQYGYSEHPNLTSWDGAVFISQVFEAILNGKNWNSTVLIVTYDENDGHFDHVAPPQPDPNADSEEFISGMSIGAGFRVPTWIISPWTFQRGICSDPYDHTSILQFLVEVTGVPCPNISNWRSSTFKSLSSAAAFDSPAPSVNVPLRPDVTTLQSNAVNRWNAAPNQQNLSIANVWQPNLLAENLVPDPPYFPPVQQGCQLIMTVPSYSQGQVLDQAQLMNSGDSATFPNALIVVVDGFEPLELTTPYAFGPLKNVPAASPPTSSCTTRVPAIAITDGNGNPVTTITCACTQIDFDPNSPANQTQSGVPQRFTFTYSLTFTDINDTVNGPFSFGAGSVEVLAVNAAFQVDITVTSFAELELVTSDDPQFYHNFDDETWYLSGELVVFPLLGGDSMFGVTLGTAGQGQNAGQADALAFINSVMTALTQNQGVIPNLPAGQISSFDQLNAQQDSISLPLYNPDLATGLPIFNFALARVHMQAQANDPATVRVFFRSFRASTTSTDYETQYAYRTYPLEGIPPTPPPPPDTKIPLLGIGYGADTNQYVTIPFFATTRIQFTDPTQPMTGQQDIPNVQVMQTPSYGVPGGGTVEAYFGCWLDINQNTKLFPITVPLSGSGVDGPFDHNSTLPIQAAFFNDLHQCLVAEISYDPITIPTDDNPQYSAWLAQRNLNLATI
jgi:phospholipase C